MNPETESLMSELISVIVPVYNCKDYLQATLASLRRQTYPNWEVILVDDGSTDGSGEICDSVCREDARFKVIHQENKGPGEARNTGLDAAKGEFIAFVDGGDAILPQTIEILHRGMTEGVDLVLTDFQIVNPDEIPSDGQVPAFKTGPVTQEELVFSLLSKTGVPGLPWAVVWNKMYRHSVLEGIRFPDLFCNEDQDLNLRVYLKIRKACFIHAPLYCYVRIPSSIVRDPQKRPKRFFTQILSRFRMLGLVPEDQFKRYRGWSLDYLYRMMLARRDEICDSDWKGRFKELSGTILKETFFRYLTNPVVSFKHKVKFLVFWPLPDIRKRWISIRNRKPSNG